MRRLQLVELHELRWFPPLWRDLLTDLMSFFARRFRPYATIADRLHDAMLRCAEERILDLCSGAAEPVLTVQEELASRGVNVSVTVTDLYPNQEVFHRLEASRQPRVRCLYQSVDAVRVPNDLPGFRTFFSAFHHFRPEKAAAILADCVRRGRGIGIFEYTERSLLRWGPLILLMPALVWAATPFIRPRSVARLLWTYLIPVVPLVAAWDALVSVLRSYLPDELLALARAVDERQYNWTSGRVGACAWLRVTYLLGVPADAAEERPLGTSATAAVALRPGAGDAE